jgi:hypothetical protein
MMLFALVWFSLFGHAQSLPSTLDQMEILSTDIKHLSMRLTKGFDTSTEESLPMLELESSMIEMENLVMQLENHISSLPPPSSL